MIYEPKRRGTNMIKISRLNDGSNLKVKYKDWLKLKKIERENHKKAVEGFFK